MNVAQPFLIPPVAKPERHRDRGFGRSAIGRGHRPPTKDETS